MLWSGEWARRHEPGAALSEAKNRPRGIRPSSEAEDRLRGRQVLERGGDSLEGYHSQSVGGPLWLLWAVGLSTLGCDRSKLVFGVVACYVLCFIIFQKGGFPL
jgi:hypothetical protein